MCAVNHHSVFGGTSVFAQSWTNTLWLEAREYFG